MYTANFFAYFMVLK